MPADDAGPAEIGVLGRQVCEVLSKDCFVLEERDGVLGELGGGVAGAEVGGDEVWEYQ